MLSKYIIVFVIDGIIIMEHARYYLHMCVAAESKILTEDEEKASNQPRPEVDCYIGVCISEY